MTHIMPSHRSPMWKDMVHTLKSSSARKMTSQDSTLGPERCSSRLSRAQLAARAGQESAMRAAMAACDAMEASIDSHSIMEKGTSSATPLRRTTQLTTLSICSMSEAKESSFECSSWSKGLDNNKKTPSTSSRKRIFHFDFASMKGAMERSSSPRVFPSWAIVEPMSPFMSINSKFDEFHDSKTPTRNNSILRE